MLLALRLNAGIPKIFHIPASEMKFVISKHALEKHLDFGVENASVFFNKTLMYTCVKRCLQRPDTSIQKENHVEVTKRFTFSVGLMSDRKQTNECVKVVYTKRQNCFFVITAYPVRDVTQSTYSSVDMTSYVANQNIVF